MNNIPNYKSFKTFLKLLVQGKNQDVSSKRSYASLAIIIGSILGLILFITCLIIGKYDLCFKVFEGFMLLGGALLGVGVAEFFKK